MALASHHVLHLFRKIHFLLLFHHLYTMERISESSKVAQGAARLQPGGIWASWMVTEMQKLIESQLQTRQLSVGSARHRLMQVTVTLSQEQLANIKHLACAKCNTCVISFSPHNGVDYLILHTWGRGFRGLRCVAQRLPAVGGRRRAHTQATRPQNLRFGPRTSKLHGLRHSGVLHAAVLHSVLQPSVKGSLQALTQCQHTVLCNREWRQQWNA